MPICPYCGATVPEGAIACGKCGASLVSSQPQTSTTFQSQPDSSSQSSSSSSPSWSGGNSSELETRFQKALRRNELLSYAVVVLSVVLIVVLFI